MTRFIFGNGEEADIVAIGLHHKHTNSTFICGACGIVNGAVDETAFDEDDYDESEGYGLYDQEEWNENDQAEDCEICGREIEVTA